MTRELTATEAAALIGVSRETIRNWILNGTLTPVRYDETAKGSQPNYYLNPADVRAAGRNVNKAAQQLRRRKP